MRGERLMATTGEVVVALPAPTSLVETSQNLLSEPGGDRHRGTRSPDDSDQIIVDVVAEFEPSP